MLLLLKPSTLSLYLCLAIGFIAIGTESWSYAASSPLLFDFVYGDQGIITIIEMSPRLFDATKAFFDSNPVVYGVFVSLAAILAGLVGFFVIRGARRAVQSLSEFRYETPVERQEEVQHVLTRLIALLLWLAYWYLFLEFLSPLSFLLSRVASDNLNPWIAGGLWIGSALVFAAAVHPHIIFARLIALRPRIFGGEADIDAALLSRRPRSFNTP